MEEGGYHFTAVQRLNLKTWQTVRRSLEDHPYFIRSRSVGGFPFNAAICISHKFILCAQVHGGLKALSGRLAAGMVPPQLANFLLPGRGRRRARTHLLLSRGEVEKPL